MQSFAHIVHQRTLTRNGDVPISSSVQDTCDSWRITCSVSHALRERSVGMLGKETAKQHLSSAKLRDGTRDSVLAVNHAGSPLHSAPLATVACFLRCVTGNVSADGNQ